MVSTDLLKLNGKELTGKRPPDSYQSLIIPLMKHGTFKVDCPIFMHFLHNCFIAGVAEIILRTQKKLSLKCLSAKVIKKNGISYKGQVPRHLEAFIELHGPGHVDILTTRPSKSDHRLWGFRSQVFGIFMLVLNSAAPCLI